MIKKQAIIDVFEETGFTDYMILSERLFRVTIGERRYAFIEIVNDNVAYNTELIDKTTDLKNILLNIKAEQRKHAARKKKNMEENTNDDSHDTDRTPV